MMRILQVVLVVASYACAFRPPAACRVARSRVRVAAASQDDCYLDDELLTPRSPLAGMVRLGGTEPAFSSALNDVKDPGVYVCAECRAPLFPSDTKYDSGTGWPSFWAAQKDAIDIAEGGFLSGFFGCEVKCSKCNGHLGHRFDDGPIRTSGKRFCINGAALRFRADPPGSAA